MHLANYEMLRLKKDFMVKMESKNYKQVETVITICQKLNLKSNGCLVKFAGNRLRNKLFLCYGLVVMSKCLMVIIKTL